MAMVAVRCDDIKQSSIKYLAYYDYLRQAPPVE